MKTIIEKIHRITRFIEKAYRENKRAGQYLFIELKSQILDIVGTLDFIGDDAYCQMKKERLTARKHLRYLTIFIIH